jgi:hypothetical protein
VLIKFAVDVLIDHPNRVGYGPVANEAVHMVAIGASGAVDVAIMRSHAATPGFP